MRTYYAIEVNDGIWHRATVRPLPTIESARRVRAEFASFKGSDYVRIVKVTEETVT
jgi:hypothetical protein